MRYLSVITLLCLTSVVTSKFPKHFNTKLNVDISKLDLSKIEQKWIDQPLDNFDPREKRTLKMRYVENLELWKPGGPIYIYFCGEGELDSFSIANYDGLLLAEIAKDTNGAMFATEHRYYGKSLPDIPINDKMKYFKFLSSEQALADVANLIKKLKTDKKYKSSKVVVVGGSYAGNLAVWMRSQYPHLVDAAVAASAPVLAKKDFHEYLDVVRYTFAKYGTARCLENIEKKYKHYERLLKSKSGIAKLKRDLNICPHTDMNVLENKQLMFSAVYEVLMDAAQYGSPSKVEYVCSSFGSSNKKIKLDFMYKNTTRRLRGNDKYCHDFDFNTMLSKMDGAGLAWTYQFCNEFGYLQTTSSEKQPFVHWNPLEFQLKYCKGLVERDIEKRLDEGIAKTNKLYGGLTPQVSRVLFSQGDMDPWHVLGVQHDLAPDAPAFTVNGTSHCGILVAKDGEPIEMNSKRKYVRNLIKKWISSS